MQKGKSVTQVWSTYGRQRFETAPCSTFQTCTRRGNLVWTRMRDNFTTAMDKLCQWCPTKSRSRYRDTKSGVYFCNDVIASVVRQLGLRSVGPFKLYFVSKMLHEYDEEFVHRFRVGPSVCLDEQNSALNLLFPNTRKEDITPQALLEHCRLIAIQSLPAEIRSRMSLDDMEHSACEWMRTMRYSDLLRVMQCTYTSEP